MRQALDTFPIGRTQSFCVGIVGRHCRMQTHRAAPCAVHERLVFQEPVAFFGKVAHAAYALEEGRGGCQLAAKL